MLFPPLILVCLMLAHYQRPPPLPLLSRLSTTPCEEEDVFKLDDPSKDADEGEEDSAFDNEDERE